MKIFLTFSLITFSLNTFGQTTRNEIAKSNIFYTATYIDEINTNKSIILREFEKDTIIENKSFRKYKTFEFEDFNKSKLKSFHYETFDNHSYIKLDDKLKPIHSIQTNKDEQEGIIFGNRKKLKLEYVDTRRSLPRDPLIPDEQTPKKFFETENPKNYFIIRTDVHIKELEIQDTLYTKHLLGDLFQKISENIDNKLSVNNQYKNSIGDEIQLVYRRKWFNEKTKIAEYEVKQFNNFKIIADEIIDNQKVITLQEKGYSYLNGIEQQPKEWKIIVTDSAYIFEGLVIPIKEYKTDLKIENNTIVLQTVSDTEIGNTKFQLINQYYSDGYYNPTILPFFPMLYYDVGNVEAYISYAKLNGTECGKKLERTYLKDHTRIWSVQQISDNAIEVHFYVVEDSEIKIEFGQEERNKTIFKTNLKRGEYKEVLQTEKLKHKEYYEINFMYQSENSSGNQTNGIIAK